MYKLLNNLNILAFELAPIFYKLLFMSITAVCIGLVILLIRKAADKKISPVWKYILWVLPLIALLLPYRPQSNFALLQTASKIENLSYRRQYDEVDFELHIAAQAQNPSSLAEEQNRIETLRKQEEITYFKSALFDVALPLLWFFGMIGGFIFWMISRILLFHKIKITSLTSDHFEKLLLECKEKLGIKTKIMILLQGYITSPSLLGIINPKIVLPKYSDNLSEETLCYIILHELAHYKRKDMLLNYLLLVLQTIYWFNPFIMFLFKFIREDMELLNDSYLLNRIGAEHSKNYARSLVEVLSKPHRISFVPKFLCMADGSKNVERRIKMIKMGASFKKNKIITSVTGVFIISVVSVLFLTSGGRLRETLNWANNLKVEDVAQIELVTMPHGSSDGYRLFEESEFKKIVSLISQSKGKYLKKPNGVEEDGGVTTFYITTKDGRIHTVANSGNKYLIIDGDVYDANYNWLSNWDYKKGDAPIPENFHYGKLSAFKGLELYVWKNTKGKPYFTLLPGTNRNKEEKEIYNLDAATKDIKQIGGILSQFEEGTFLFLIQMRPEDFTEDEINDIVNQLSGYFPENIDLRIGTFSKY